MTRRRPLERLPPERRGLSALATQQRAELTIRAVAWDARRASAWLETSALAQGVPNDQIVRLDHCLDEALANVVKHGGPTALASAVLLQFCVERGRNICTAELLVVDAGVPFDSTVRAAPARTPASLAEVDPGGLGLRMLRTFADDLSYHRTNDRNHLAIRVRWSEET